MNKIRIFLCFVALIMFLSININPSQSLVNSEGIMLQSFGWNSTAYNTTGKWYDFLSEKADDIAKTGITMIWLPPVVRSVSQQGYMPTDYYDLGKEGNSTYYGNLGSLSSCIKKLHEKNLYVIADIVINHRCAGKQDENGIWNVYHFGSGLAQWENWAICGDDNQFNGSGNNDTGAEYGAAPDIDHVNKNVRKDIKVWMNWMRELGFDGWRYDFVKGYSSNYIKEYNEATNTEFSVGEYWTSLVYESPNNPAYNQDSHRQQLCDWLDKAGDNTTAFDFTTKGILQVAVNGQYWRLKDKDGKASGLIGWWPEKAVTFIDNHDTGSVQNHWPFPSEKVIQGYAYILTHPGIPCVFWEHLYDWGLKSEISKMIHLRKSLKINSKSVLKILKAEDGLYAAMIDNKLVVKLGSKDYNPGSEFNLKLTGNQYTIWVK